MEETQGRVTGYQPPVLVRQKEEAPTFAGPMMVDDVPDVFLVEEGFVVVGGGEFLPFDLPGCEKCGGTCHGGLYSTLRRPAFVY